MVRRMQPCDWQEHDFGQNYVIDAYGRSPDKETLRVRILNFKPYFYMKPQDGVVFGTGIKTSTHEKFDIFAGFNGFKAIEVLKVECPTLFSYREAIKLAKSENAVLYEANIPPFLRFFHERGISPASPFLFQPKKLDPNSENEDIRCDRCYIADYQDISSDSGSTIPLKVCCYDLEVFSESGQFPMATNPSDQIIQIGITMRWSTDMMAPILRKVLVLGTATEDPLIESFPSEADLLQEFANFIGKENPDIICGYNTFGFDDAYLVRRAQFRKLKLQFGRARVGNSKRPKPLTEELLEHKTFELASGKYDVNYIRMPGRLAIDLLLNMRREHTLDSYKLDSVAAVFLRDKVVKVEGARVFTKSTRGLRVNNYVCFDIVGNTSDPYRDGEKFLVTDVKANSFEVRLSAGVSLFEDLDPATRKMVEWSFTKDDIHPADIFRMQMGTPEDRATIARYCIQDCDLVATLMAKLDTLVNARGMADVCIVPMSYLFLRGQGIKIYSRIAFEAMNRNQIILTQEAEPGEGIGYEGAIVIPPKIGMYLDQPIPVLDYNSLYPSSMIGENLSPDTLAQEKYYDEEGKVKSVSGLSNDAIAEYKKQGFTFNELRFSADNGTCVCVYLRPPEGAPLGIGVIPQTLQILLAKRKESRQMAEYKTVTCKDGTQHTGLVSEKGDVISIKGGQTLDRTNVNTIEDTYDDAQKSVFNGLQMAYKVVANSVYGQMGSRTSPIRKTCVAACTTYVGRRSLLFAKETVEKEFNGEVIYGDTDSIFIKFPTKDLVESMELGRKAAALITSRCPHRAFVIGYEKTLYPFILFCRKRYVGMMYEDDPTKCKRKSMGIVLKRRDNAPIVKDVFGGALDMLLDRKPVAEAADFVKSMLTRILKADVPIEKFVITKQLRDDYKDRTKIAHRVLADRMTKRDPGNAPNVGDRMQFVYIKKQTQDKKVLQGDRIEDLQYVKDNKLLPDSEFYITNQIQNPVASLFALCIEKLPGFKQPSTSYAELYNTALEKAKSETMEEKEEEAILWVLDQKEKQLDTLLFLGNSELKKIVVGNQRGPMDAFLKKKV